MLKLTEGAYCSTIEMFMVKRPVIGIAMRLELETRRFYLGRDYSEALAGLGAVPVHISLIPDVEYIKSVCSGLDGVLLPGSDSDVDPAFYGDSPHPKLGRVVPEKDTVDRLILEQAEKLSLPVFGICYGMQALNVFRGGSLIQDVVSQVPSAIKHEQGVPLARNSHQISVKSGSLLNEICGKESIFVNSHHHQAVRDIGKGLTATAWADDGVVECIEDAEGSSYCIGVQWHPELSWDTDPVSKQLFERFISSCSQGSRSSGG